MGWDDFHSSCRIHSSGVAIGQMQYHVLTKDHTPSEVLKYGDAMKNNNFIPCTYSVPLDLSHSCPPASWRPLHNLSAQRLFF